MTTIAPDKPDYHVPFETREGRHSGHTAGLTSAGPAGGEQGKRAGRPRRGFRFPRVGRLGEKEAALAHGPDPRRYSCFAVQIRDVDQGGLGIPLMT